MVNFGKLLSVRSKRNWGQNGYLQCLLTYQGTTSLQASFTSQVPTTESALASWFFNSSSHPIPFPKFLQLMSFPSPSFSFPYHLLDGLGTLLVMTFLSSHGEDQSADHVQSTNFFLCSQLFQMLLPVSFLRSTLKTFPSTLLWSGHQFIPFQFLYWPLSANDTKTHSSGSGVWKRT